MYKKVFLIINEQHSLLPDQERCLNDRFPGIPVENVAIPAEGMTKHELNQLAFDLYHRAVEEKGVIVLVSPVPILIKNLTEMIYTVSTESQGAAPNTMLYIFHNDRREKKELPNGKIISVVAQDGWEII